MVHVTERARDMFKERLDHVTDGHCRPTRFRKYARAANVLVVALLKTGQASAAISASAFSRHYVMPISR
jgi:hypothetical protein